MILLRNFDMEWWERGGGREEEGESQDTRLLSIKSMNSVSNLTCEVSVSFECK